MRPRVAILGAGIGAQHLDGYLALGARFEIAAICDRDAERAGALAAKAPGAVVATEIDAALSDPAIDVVDICLPPDLHAPVAARALSAGKHVVCEKPIATSLHEGAVLQDAAAAADRLFVPVFQYRYGLAFAQLDALIAEGLAGRPFAASLETHWNRTADYYAAPWRGTWAAERGGAVLSHAIHIHDLAMLYFGDATDVSAMIDTRVNPIETEDCAAISIRTRSGGLVSSSITLGAADDTSRLRLVFERLTAESGAAAYAPGQAAWRFTARDPADQARVDAVLAGTAPPPAGFAGLFDALWRKLAGQPAHDLVTLADGLRSIEFVAAAYLSSREGRRVALPLDRSHPICADWRPPR